MVVDLGAMRFDVVGTAQGFHGVFRPVIQVRQPAEHRPTVRVVGVVPGDRLQVFDGPLVLPGDRVQRSQLAVGLGPVGFDSQ